MEQKKRKMKRPQRKLKKRRGSILALAVILTVLLTMAGFAMLKAAEGRLSLAVRTKSQESAAAAAEAAYEKAIFWMSQQMDLLTSLQTSTPSDALTFEQSSADYTISLASFLGSRPIFKVSANGHCGIYKKTIDAYVVQAVAGWEMGRCRIPSSTNSTDEVSFVNGEMIAMPLHINALNEYPDSRDIYITGSPTFLEHISMGESRYTTSGSDKYKTVIGLFSKGISFGQPASRIYDEDTVAAKVDRFYDSTASAYRFTPTKVTLPKSSDGKTGFYSATISDLPAVQLKFYVKSNGQGYVRIYNNCTVAGYTRDSTDDRTWDYKVNPSGSPTFMKYPIYGCHYTKGTYTDVRIDDESASIYVRQNYNGVQSDPGAQIYVNGNIVIGCGSEDASTLGTLNTVKGRIAVVATGNIWIANELKVAGTRDTNGMPALDNPNIIGLIAEGVIKVVDTGMTTTNKVLYDVSKYNATKISNYAPIGNAEGSTTYDRQLPYQMVVEAAMTVGGGGWGAENVYRTNKYTGRETYYSNTNDKLFVRGSITESYRGIVGSGNNGYSKQYYYDRRLMTGILPGNIGLKGKYLLIPGGWSESASITSH
jgi:hypothetical protein